jgi:hypothetical protein
MSSDTIAGNDRNNVAPMIRDVLGNVMQGQLDASLINATEEPS